MPTRVIKKLYFTAILSLSISIPVLAAETNLVVNPGFELGDLAGDLTGDLDLDFILSLITSFLIIF